MINVTELTTDEILNLSGLHYIIYKASIHPVFVEDVTIKRQKSEKEYHIELFSLLDTGKVHSIMLGTNKRLFGSNEDFILYTYKEAYQELIKVYRAPNFSNNNLLLEHIDNFLNEAHTIYPEAFI